MSGLNIKIALLMAMVIVPSAVVAQDFGQEDSVALNLVEAGFADVRSARTSSYKVYTIENDLYKIPLEGFAQARRIIEREAARDSMPVNLIGTYYGIPEVTMSYDPVGGRWSTTKRLDRSWDVVRSQKKENSSFGNINIVLYPQVSLKNLIITQVYQSLWQLNPTLEVSLWRGAKFTYQIKVPVWNDGYGAYESKIHYGALTLSQRFRDPWNLNVFGKFTVGSFTNNRYGAALEMRYYFPNERFSLDTQLGLLGPYSHNGFNFYYDDHFVFRWNVGLNYYNAALQTQFRGSVQRFLLADYGLKGEMIRHFRHCSVGFYGEKGFKDYQNLNVGFRFQISLPPYKMKRHGRWPKITTSGQMGMNYNSNNERVYYKEYKTETSDNIAEKNYFNPYYLDTMLKKQ